MAGRNAMRMLSTALLVAARFHHDQFRKHTGLPYVLHPIDVMRALWDAGIGDEEVLAAAVLHDVVEDTEYGLEQCRADFGDRVTTIVGEMTKRHDQTKRVYMESFSSKSAEAVIVKVVDRHRNIVDYRRDDPSKVPAYTEEARPLFEVFGTRRADLIARFGPSVVSRLERMVEDMQRDLLGPGDSGIDA